MSLKDFSEKDYPMTINASSDKPIIEDEAISSEEINIGNHKYSVKIIGLFNQEPFKLKYELCEVAFCKVSANLKNLGFTVMDGDFFPLCHLERGTVTPSPP